MGDSAGTKGARRLIKRHTLPVRLTHWANAFVLALLLLSGLQIFNAHPALYLGHVSHFDTPLISLEGVENEAGELRGIVNLFGAEFNATGVFGASEGFYGMEARAFPGWMTLPSYTDLAQGRRWHFFFAWLFVLNGLIYLLFGLFSGHLRRDLVPSVSQLKHLPKEIADHARLRFPKGEAARSYNGIQKLTYLAVIAVLAPVVVLTGMTMSPGLNAAFPFLVDLFGGRQTARTIHFVCALGFVLFIFVHVVMVLVSGVWNNMRSMITGRYDLGVERGQ